MGRGTSEVNTLVDDWQFADQHTLTRAPRGTALGLDFAFIEINWTTSTSEDQECL